MRRHRHDLADSDHTHAADAGDQRSVRMVKIARPGFGKRWKFRLAVGRRRLALLQAPAFDRDKARAKSFQAGIVLVARGLIDRALPAEFGLEDRKSTRLNSSHLGTSY